MTREQRIDEINNLCLFLMEVNNKLNSIKDEADRLGRFEIVQQVKEDITKYKAFKEETLDELERLEDEAEQEDIEEYERGLDSLS